MREDSVRQQLDAARSARADFGERARWGEADKAVDAAIEAALAQPIPLHGPDLGDLVYVAGGPRPRVRCANQIGSGLPPERLLAMRAMSLANRGIDRAEAVEIAEQVLASDGWADAGCFWYSVLALCYADELDLARAHCERAQRCTEWTVTTRHRDALTLLGARVAYLSGRAGLSQRLLSEALQRGVYQQFTGLAVAWSALSLAELHEQDAGAELLHRNDFTGNLAGLPDSAELLFARGTCHFIAGRHELACTDLLACGRELAGWSVSNPAVLPWRSQVALSAAALGKHSLAVPLAQEELVAARRWDSARSCGIALRALAVVGEESNLEQLNDAAELFTRSGAQHELIGVHYAFGAVLQTRRQPAAARTAFTNARELALRDDNEIWVRRIDEALDRLTRSAEHGSLTAQEMTTVRLAAAGRSNQQIADQLGLTSRTVEYRLSSAYRKLGISGRTELSSVALLSP